MNKGHKLLSLLLCAAVLLTLISPAALAEGETLPENEVVLSKAPAASAAQEGAGGEAAEETPAPQATPRPQESQAAGESPENTPAESPAESPKESPAESPKESPVESPKESSAESPKESPAESPKESPAQTPAGEFTISYDYNGGAAGALLMLNAAQNGENAAQNGENAAPAPTAESVTGNSGQKIVLANAPIKPDRDFAGWKSTLTGKQYAAGESYEIQGDDTLVAQWNMRSVLEIDVQPEEGSKLLACEKTISAISEDEQALVEQAIKNAQPATGDALMLSAFEPEVLASDVSFIGADGREQQPAQGETVPMTVTVPAGAMEGEGFWMVYHLTENGEGGYIATPVQFMPADANGASVQLAADGFSIYAVAKVQATEGEPVAAGSEIEMPVESSKVFYYKDEDQYKQYTYHRYTWTIEGNDDFVKGYATPMSNLTEQLNRYQYPWLSVDALREGTVTVKLNYYYYNGRDWWHPTETDSGSIAFTINVTEPTGLRILNNIVENGTLKPVYEEADGTLRNDLTYVWSAKFFHTDNNGGEQEIENEDSSIDLDAVYPDGSLNVAIDNGGIREETDINGKEVLHVTTYTVTAYDKDGKEVGKASHRVEFGGNVLNGSFEYPAIPSGSTNYAFANGTHQLFWRTTAPGPNHMLGQDVELGNSNPGNPYLQDGSAAHGKQYAELNAEAMGTLYQDVLTAPGAELSWGFSHRSRKYTGDNIMYLIIASSEDGAKIDTQAQINDLIDHYNHSNGDGETVTYDGGSYTLWKMEGDANHWQNHFGSYKVPDGQYATRFFFASATGTTTGNLIDNVTFNQEQRYIIEYYLNGTKVDSLTETKTAEVNTAVSPKNLESTELTNAILADSTINGESYGGVTMTILPRPEVDAEHPDCRNVLRLYFVTGAITVRKVVTIEDWDDLTDDERKDLSGNKPYVANFELYKGAPGTGEKVASASVSIDLINQSQKTGVAQFMQLNTDGSKEPYKPEASADYWVKEVNVSTQTPLYAYELTTTYAPNANGSFTTDEHANGSVTVTNAYALHLFDLTIKTSGVEDIDENQTYVYRVRGDDDHTKLIDLTVAIHGNGEATVKNLPSGEYKVTQVNAWSWRYTPDQTAERSVTLNANGTVVEYKQTRAQEVDGGNKWKWLNGQHWIDNRWMDVSSSGDVPGDEGGDENSIKDGKGR